MMGAKRWTQVAVCGGAGLLLAPGCNVRANASGWGSEASEFVDELPKTPSGKIQRFVLRNQAKEEIGA